MLLRIDETNPEQTPAMPPVTDQAASPSFTPAYRRVLLKLSGEGFCRPGENGLSMAAVSTASEQIKRVVAAGVQLAIVVGGGNILRGREFSAVSSSISPSRCGMRPTLDRINPSR